MQELLVNENFDPLKSLVAYTVSEASSLPSKYQVTCDLVGSKNLVAFKGRCENVLVAFTGSHFFSHS